MKRVILVTGASSGIGKATAELLAQNAENIVYGAARNLAKLEPLQKLGIIPLQLDITDPNSCKAAVQTIVANQKHLDVLVNCAGFGSFGSIEQVSIKAAQQQFSVNVFGTIDLIKLVLPIMREQHFGEIINVSSISGQVSFAFSGWYAASKYSLEALTDALRQEVKPFGIKVVLIEPGPTKSNWANIADQSLVKTSMQPGSPYKDQATKIKNFLAKNAQRPHLPTADSVAQKIVKAINSDHPKARYVTGPGSKFLIFWHKFLPTKLFDYLTQKAIK